MITYKVKSGSEWVEIAAVAVPRYVRDEAEIGRHGSGVIEHVGRKYRWRQDDPAIEVGQKIGQAIARDTLAEGMPRTWTGLDAQDGDVATSAGIAPDTDQWATMERMARETFERIVGTKG